MVAMRTRKGLIRVFVRVMILGNRFRERFKGTFRTREHFQSVLVNGFQMSIQRQLRERFAAVFTDYGLIDFPDNFPVVMKPIMTAVFAAILEPDSTTDASRRGIVVSGCNLASLPMPQIRREIG